MKNNASVFYTLMLVVGDFLAVLLAFGAAFLLRFQILDPQLAETVSGQNFVLGLSGILPVWILINGLLGLYSNLVYERRFVELGRLLAGSVVGIMAVITYDFFADTELFPGRLVPIYGVLIAFIFLVVFRNLARAIRRAMFRYGRGVSNLLIVGDTPITKKVVSSLSNTAYTGQNIVGTVGYKVDGIPNYKSFADAIERSKEPIHSVVQTELYSDGNRNNEILDWSQKQHASYRFVPGNSDLLVGNIEVELFMDLPMIAVHQTALTGWGRIFKRLFDLVIGSFILIIASPIMLIVALLVKITDPKGPVFLRQTRLTRFNKKFTALKFRSMKHQYSGMSPEDGFTKMGRPELIKEYRDNGDQVENDPRLTPLGKFIRRVSLDELAQLFNVLTGDLSLVGPRALVPEELNSYDKKHAILSVKSGLTGLAQVSGRRDISFEERRQLDIYYVQNWSLWLDISILLRTVRVILTGSGAK